MATTIIPAADFGTDRAPKGQAYLYVEAGGPQMLPVRYIRQDWWVVTGPEGSEIGRLSWACTPQTPLYFFDSPSERQTELERQAKLRQDFIERMQQRYRG